MFSGTTKYLMDANAIRGLDIAMISSKLSNGRIIATIPEVKHEVASLVPKLDLIQIEPVNTNGYKKMAEILDYAAVRAVISYYDNKGAADVALLAHSLTVENIGMFQDQVVIVTDDGDLRTACSELGVLWKSVEDFKSI